MKTLITFLGLMLLGQTSLAGPSVFSYRTVLVEQSKAGKFCPQIVTTTAVNEQNSLRGQAVHLVDNEGLSYVFTYKYSTRACREDVVCVSQNHYLKADSPVIVSLKLNNNGDYPTVDLPGYTSLKLSWNNAQGHTSKYCTYMFF